MPHITLSLSDETYEIARQRATEGGFASAEEFIVELLQRQLDADNELAERRNEWLRQNEQR